MDMCIYTTKSEIYAMSNSFVCLFVSFNADLFKML
jgi:hypothetical protein